MGEVQTAMPFGVEHDPSQDSDSYCTPDNVWALVDQVWPDGWHLDPMTNRFAVRSGTVANWTISDDALARPSWHVTDGPQRTWLNPPYSGPWDALRRLVSEWFAMPAGSEAMALVKQDTSTRWWADCANTATVIAMLSMRVAFLRGGAPVSGSNFTSAIFYWGPRASTFRRVFHKDGIGWVYPGERKPPHWRA